MAKSVILENLGGNISKVVTTDSAQETKKLAQELAIRLKPGAVICLIGQLGSGKTTFIQGIAKGLGIKDYVLSPSFKLINEYNNFLCHIDLYRLDKIEEIENLGCEEYFYSQGITVVEWAEKIKKSWPKKRIEIYFKITGENQRKINIKYSKV